MVYYVKQGQNSIFRNIKILEDECTITSTIYKSNKKKIEKLAKKMRQKGINQVVLSKQLKGNSEFIESLNNYDITIFDGKWLMQYLLEDIILYLKNKNKISDLNEITILANDLTDEVKQNVKKFANTYKKIRIVTNHLEKFKRIENELYEEKGVAIILTNNKRKALVNSLLIINFDFVQETVDKYSINENATIINLNGKIKINKKRFCGVIITDYEVEILNTNDENMEKYFNIKDVLDKKDEFYLKEILERLIYLFTLENSKFNTFSIIEGIIKKYQIEIKTLFGTNNLIS